jgi:hypothetical protein
MNRTEVGTFMNVMTRTSPKCQYAGVTIVWDNPQEGDFGFPYASFSFLRFHHSPPFLRVNNFVFWSILGRNTVIFRDLTVKYEYGLISGGIYPLNYISDNKNNATDTFFRLFYFRSGTF